MAFFSLLARAAGELGLPTPAISKRLAQMEARLGVQPLNPTTRRVCLTQQGEIDRQHARRILADIEDMERLVADAVAAPHGVLRVDATQGFGRSHIAPLISRFVKQHPQVELQFTVKPPPGDAAFDVGVRLGEPPDARRGASLITPNRRLRRVGLLLLA